MGRYRGRVRHFTLLLLRSAARGESCNAGGEGGSSNVDSSEVGGGRNCEVEPMRVYLAGAMILALGAAWAQDQGPVASPPPATARRPEAPPPPPIPAGGQVDEETLVEPEVTIVQRGRDTVEEYRVNGVMYMVKVLPAGGVPYYLIDTDGDGSFDSKFTEFSPNLVLPHWVLYRW